MILSLTIKIRVNQDVLNYCILRSNLRFEVRQALERKLRKSKTAISKQIRLFVEVTDPKGPIFTVNFLIQGHDKAQKCKIIHGTSFLIIIYFLVLIIKAVCKTPLIIISYYQLNKCVTSSLQLETSFLPQGFFKFSQDKQKKSVLK